MPGLTDEQRGSVNPADHTQRDGYAINATNQATNTKQLYEASCGCWALFGKYVADSADAHPNNTYFGLFEDEDYDIGLYNHPRDKDGNEVVAQHNKMRTIAIPTQITGLERYDEEYEALTQIVRDNFEQAVADSHTQLEAFKEDGFDPALLAGLNPMDQVVTDAQIACKKALMKIAAGIAGLEVAADNAASNYRLLMVTSAWYGWDHWAVGVTSNGWESIIQTVPDIPVKYGCSTIWDEHFHVDGIKLVGLQQDHVDVLATVAGQ